MKLRHSSMQEILPARHEKGKKAGNGANQMPSQLHNGQSLKAGNASSPIRLYRLPNQEINRTYLIAERVSIAYSPNWSDLIVNFAPDRTPNRVEEEAACARQNANPLTIVN